MNILFIHDEIKIQQDIIVSKQTRKKYCFHFLDKNKFSSGIK
jgi:hypothetical protein